MVLSRSSCVSRRGRRVRGRASLSLAIPDGRAVPLAFGQPLCLILIECLPLRRRHDDRYPICARCLDSFESRGQRRALHDHTRATAIGAVVDTPAGVVGVVARVPAGKLETRFAQPTPDHAELLELADPLGEQRDDIDTHCRCARV